MKKRVKILAAILAGMMVVGMTACGSKGTKTEGTDAQALEAGTEEAVKTEESKEEGGERIVTIAMSSSWSGWDPFQDSGTYSDIISDQLYERLWVTNMDGTVEPRLAQSYEVAEDHTSMTVHLNPEAKFHDGEPVTADDVVFSAWLTTNPEFNSIKRDLMYYLAGTTPGGVAIEGEQLGVEKVDDYTVKITFKEAMNELPILTMLNRYLYIVPEHIYSQYTMEELNQSETWRNNMIGCGPFIFDNTVEGERVEFTTNKDYYLGAADFDRLIIRVVESSQMLAGLMTGEIDTVAGSGIGAIPLSDWPVAQEQENLETLSLPNYSYQCMIVNMGSSKIPNATCRLGINTAINRQSIVDNLLQGEGEVIYAPYSDKHPFVDESKLELPEYNPEKAKALLEEGGFDFSQTLELIVPVGNEVRIQSTVLIQQDLEAIGVKTNITQYDFPTLMSMMREGDFDLGMVGASGAIEPSAECSVWLNNEGTNNFPCVPDDRFNVLFNKVRGILDIEEQKEGYVEVWQKILDESPICYLYSSNYLLAYNKDKILSMDPTKFSQVNWAIWQWDITD